MSDGGPVCQDKEHYAKLTAMGEIPERGLEIVLHKEQLGLS